ncbi:hypothetical protein Q0Z83_042410 [Actinoplanes sichuanensis]|uniref:Thioesterase TesA-like domain-containing protein n=1 Tax=Actinoplanes sichuanensis TaxID=512349 RepID=A0ABW4AUF3_9ACTN|nr:hypothetical protein [Actinoplanes sichuanensis]BEL06050.1 hypothetical protein Q0Z83_042410 [Actinoplanes sichuanensis]
MQLVLRTSRSPSADRRHPHRLDGWEPEPSSLPTLLVRATPTKEMRETDPAGRWQPHWPRPHEVVDVAGDHYSMLTTHAEATTDAIRTWLDGLT